MNYRIAIGLMSGTSADGIDAVACRVTGRGDSMRATVLSRHFQPYPPRLARELLAVMAPAATTTEAICRLDVQIGRAFAQAAAQLMRKSRLSPKQVSVIGSHGQTICHLPAEGATLQIGRAAEIAARTGVPVVSDFRSADMAVGGQGAPLVPWTDWLLLRDPRRSRVVQNIGGIANLTWLPAGGTSDRVIAFDTGPGNMIIDELVRTFSKGRESFDRNGRKAAQGRVDPDVLREWSRHPFLQARPPKSCGREQFGRDFVANSLKRHRSSKIPPNDWIATATMFTATSIAAACRNFLPQRAAIDELILCGGGAKNPTLRAWLAAILGQTRVRTIDELGIRASDKEALSFALLACARIDAVPANLPRVTGARRRVILGQLSHP